MTIQRTILGEMATATRLAPALDTRGVRDIVRRALDEDIGTGDLTTGLTVTPGSRATATIVAKAAGVVAGLPVAELTFRELDPDVRWYGGVTDGDWVVPGAQLARLEGLAVAILSAERTALNFMQRLSGIATAAREMVRLAAGRATIIDTRKTVPGLRLLDKYAVAAGGARNHRVGLFDGVLLKENHLRAGGGIAEAVRHCRAGVPLLTKIEVEVTNLQELDEALAAGADVVLLDNMSPREMREAVARTAGRALLEASGNVTLDTVPEIAATGVDFISSGALTHSVKALDISLLVEL